MRLNKFIASSGICSRRKADELIEDGKIRINGKIVTVLGIDVKENDKVEYNNKVININEEKIYLMLNKPKGYITTAKEQFDRKCVMDLIHESIRVFPIGRLDKDTEGLLLLTNDGELTNKLTHPSHEIRKKYIVYTDTIVKKEQLETLRNGVDIGGYITKKAYVKMLDKNNIEIIISEGKNRQIRKMCENTNIHLISLKRVAIGNLTLDGLEVGKYRKLDKKDLEKVFE